MKLVKNLEDVKGQIHFWKKKPVTIRAVQLQEEVAIQTREGTLKGHPGDFLIEGLRKEVYPCGKEIFKHTYQKV